jgi:hypothetical protein
MKSIPSISDIQTRLDNLPWNEMREKLSQQGSVVIPQILSSFECQTIAGWYDQQNMFRSRIVMHRYGFGRGEYQYFSYPLPSLIQALRQHLYAHLVPVANDWHQSMGLPSRFPLEHELFVQRCHQADQKRPTPLLVQYHEGDYNCLHQDLYGEHVFPLQGVILLSQPQVDFAGGELVLTEQRPRMQSRVEVLPISQGDLVIFAVHHRPVNGTRGSYRVNMRHGVSQVRSGKRHTLGIIFHDAN